MKPKISHSFPCPRPLWVASLTGLVLTLNASAVDRYWDANGATSGMGGAGNWTTTTNLWRTDAGADANGGTLGAWVNQATDTATNAVLSGTGGTLTTTAAITTNKITVSSGGFAVSNGTGGSIAFAGAGAGISIATGATLALNPSLLSSTVGLAVSGGGTLTFAAANRAYGGSLAVTGSGTRVIFSSTNGLANTGSNAHSFGAGTTLQVNGANNYYSVLTLNAATVDSRSASGLVLQSGGGITVTGSATSVVASNSASTGVTLNATNVPFNIGGTGDESGVDLDFTAKLSGAQNFAKSGAGTLRLSGANTFGTGIMNYGASNAARGYLRLASDGALGNITGLSLLGAGTATSGVQLEGGITISKPLTSSGRGSATTTGYILRNLKDNNTWSGTVTIAGTGGAYGLVSDAGTLTFSNNLTSSLALANGTRNFSFAGEGNFLVTGNIIRTSASTGDVSISKDGTGTLTLNGSNNYEGATTINLGTLTLGNTASIAASIATIAADATLTGGGTLGGDTTIAGTHSPGFSPGTQTFSGGLTYASTSTLIWEFVGDTLATRGTDYDAVNVTGGDLTVDSLATLALLAGSVDYSNELWSATRYFTVIDYSGVGSSTGNFALDASGAGSFTSYGSWSSSNDSGDIVLRWSPIPEPDAALLGGIGLILLLRRRRVAG